MENLSPEETEARAHDAEMARWVAIEVFRDMLRSSGQKADTLEDLVSYLRTNRQDLIERLEQDPAAIDASIAKLEQMGNL